MASSLGVRSEPLEGPVAPSLGLRRGSRACGAAVVLIGGAALLGWATDNSRLLGLRADYIPMAPNTALVFLVLGAGLWLIAGGGALGRRIAGLGGALVALAGALRFLELVS